MNQIEGKLESVQEAVGEGLATITIADRKRYRFYTRRANKIKLAKLLVGRRVRVNSQQVIKVV